MIEFTIWFGSFCDDCGGVNEFAANRSKEAHAECSLFFWNSLRIHQVTMRLTTAALVLSASTFGAKAFVPRAPFAARGAAKAPPLLFMSEAPTAEAVAGETYE